MKYYKPTKWPKGLQRQFLEETPLSLAQRRFEDRFLEIRSKNSRYRSSFYSESERHYGNYSSQPVSLVVVDSAAATPIQAKSLIESETVILPVPQSKAVRSFNFHPGKHLLNKYRTYLDFKLKKLEFHLRQGQGSSTLQQGGHASQLRDFAIKLVIQMKRLNKKKDSQLLSKFEIADYYHQNEGHLGTLRLDLTQEEFGLQLDKLPGYELIEDQRVIAFLKRMHKFAAQ